MKRLLIAGLIAVASLAAGGSASAATPPTPVTIEGHSIFANGFGTFTTSGAGLCPSGVTTDSSLGQMSATGFQSGNHVIFHDLKTFTCGDGSGTFTALLEVHLVFGASADSFTWRILTGTGAYADLHGTGSGVGIQLPGAVDDHYVGSVHFD